MKTEEIFNQEVLNNTLEANIIFSADIICKVINKQLFIEKSCLGDWLESLSDDEANMLVDYFNQAKGEEVKEKESEDLIAQDLSSCLEFLHLLECGTSDNFDGEKMPEMLEFLDIACNLELLRREGVIDILEKAKISNPNSGLVKTKTPKKKRKPRLEKLDI